MILWFYKLSQTQHLFYLICGNVILGWFIVLLEIYDITWTY